MLLGIAQTSPIFGDKPANRSEIESLCGNAKADLWVFTELALTGYEFRDRAEAMELAEEIPEGESVLWLEGFCRERNCHAVMGLAERDGTQVFNSCAIVGPKGILGSYRKLHLFDKEKDRFDQSKQPFQVFDLGFARVGLMICFDWRFPEAARTLTLMGAQILAHPSNLVMTYCQAAMVTRALENRVYCATANRVGEETRAGRPVRFTGGSQIVAPSGDLLAVAPVDSPSIAVVDIDPSTADDKTVTPHNKILHDRRPDFYLS